MISVTEKYLTFNGEVVDALRFAKELRDDYERFACDMPKVLGDFVFAIEQADWPSDFARPALCEGALSPPSNLKEKSMSKTFSDDRNYFVIDMNWSQRLIVPLSQSTLIDGLFAQKNLFEERWSDTHKVILKPSDERLTVKVMSGKDLNELMERGELAAAAAAVAATGADNDSAPLREAAE
jgi:hypothetical protein